MLDQGRRKTVAMLLMPMFATAVDIVRPTNSVAGVIATAGRSHRKVGTGHDRHRNGWPHPAAQSTCVRIQVTRRSAIRVLQFVAFGHDRLRFRRRRRLRSQSAPESGQRTRPVAQQATAATIPAARRAAATASQRFVAFHFANDAHVSRR